MKRFDWARLPKSFNINFSKVKTSVGIIPAVGENLEGGWNGVLNECVGLGLS